MTPSWRKPAGILLILLLIFVWAIAVANLAEILTGLPWPVHLIFYGAAGLIWVLPLKPLLLWMETGRWRPRHEKHGR